MIERYTSPEMAELWSSANKYQTWLEIELAVCEVLSERNIIPVDDWKQIRERSSFSEEAIQKAEARSNHDVAAFIEVVETSVGPAGRWLHYGMTSSDLVDTGLAILMARAIGIVRLQLAETKLLLEEKIRDAYCVPVVGRTHGQHAERLTFGLKFATMRDELGRSDKRLMRAAAESCLGKLSGAVGSYSQLAPEIEVEVFAKLEVRHALTSSQVVSRDTHADVLSTLAILGGVLERWSTEIRNLLRPEIGELSFNPDPHRLGSSCMPHKVNPIEFEKICGLARVVRSYLAAALESVALWHERDLTNSSVERITIPGSFCLIDHMVRVFNSAFRAIQVESDSAQRNLSMFPAEQASQRLLLQLVERGMSRSAAHTAVKDALQKAKVSGSPLEDIFCSDKASEAYLSRDELASCLEPADLGEVTLKILARIGINPREEAKPIEGVA